MASVNKVILVGNLGDAPVVAATASNRAVANVGLATNKKWKDKLTGEKKELTTWHRLVFFDRLAEIASQYLVKGMSIYVEGYINNRSWQDEQGNTRYGSDVVVQKMEMISGGIQQAPQQHNNTMPQQHNAAMSQQHNGATQPDYDDDIPF